MRLKLTMYGLLESNPENRKAESPRYITSEATPDDIRAAIQILRKKPEGIAAGQDSTGIFAEAKAAVYESLGIVARRGPVLKLTSFGWEMARQFEPASDSFREVINHTRHYHAVLDRAFRQCVSTLTLQDVTDFWLRQCPEVIGAEGEQNDSAVGCFFDLCQAAALGNIRGGDGRNPLSFRLDREELAAYLAPNAFPRLVVASREGTSMAQEPDPQPPPSDPPRGHALPAGRTLNGQTLALRILSLAIIEELDNVREDRAEDGARGIDFAEEVRRFETALLKSALACADGRQRRAARLLNMTKSTFNAKLKRYNIQSSSGVPAVSEGGEEANPGQYRER